MLGLFINIGSKNVFCTFIKVSKESEFANEFNLKIGSEFYLIIIIYELSVFTDTIKIYIRSELIRRFKKNEDKRKEIDKWTEKED